MQRYKWTNKIIYATKTPITIKIMETKTINNVITPMLPFIEIQIKNQTT